jgi:hypothetical protein
MNSFLKFACMITGDESSLLEKSTPESRKKVKAFAIAIMVPVLIWGSSSFLLAYMVLQAAWWKALLVALVVTAVIFTIERLIIMAKGNNNWLAAFRIAIGLCTALLGAVIIDDLLFSDAINQQLLLVKQDHAREAGRKAGEAFLISRNYEEKKLEVSKKQADWQIKHEAVLREADGTGGSGKAGVDGITLFKKQEADKIKAEIEVENSKLAILETEKAEAEKMATDQALTHFNPNNLLYRIKALFQLVTSDGWMFTVYFVFTLLMFLMEFLVIIFKSTWEKSAHEYRMEAMEAVHREQTKRLYGTQSPYNQAHVVIPEVRVAAKSLSSSFHTLL